MSRSRPRRTMPCAPALLTALLAGTACVEQSRERKKFGRTFESTRSGAYMPFNFAPVPDGRWADPSTEWKMNTAAGPSGSRTTK